MGKKKRVGPNNLENSVSESETSNSASKEGNSGRPDSESPSENIPIFKNSKFVQAKANSKKGRVWKSLRQITTAEKAIPRAVTYLTIDVPVSLKPPKKYSDLSGLEAKYTHPSNRMRFANAAEFEIIKNLTPEVINSKEFCNISFKMRTLFFMKIQTSILLKRRFISSKSYFVSTPIFYVNGAPHIGHMQSSLYADAFARMQCLLGKSEIIFSTGTDEHGLKVQRAASAKKKNPAEYCTEMSAEFQDTFNKGDINFSHFIRTTDAKHKATVQNFWMKIKKNGFIKKGHYEGWYSVTDEAFVPSSQIKEIKEGNTVKMISSETGSVLEKMSEENYIFPLSHFQDDILQWLSKDVIKPALFLDDIKRWMKEGLDDLSISRPKSRLSWGIPVPDDESQIVYVWLDALVNYLTVGYHARSDLIWPIDCHVIGKDILKFHAIYWPAFLMAAGYEPPRKIFCHSHWTVNYEKMSKSKGNVIDPINLINKYGCDGFRYFLLRASVPTNDTNYSEQKIHRMLNAELANTLGNLLRRSCVKAVNPDQVFPRFFHHSLDSLKDYNIEEIIKNASELPEKVQQFFLEGYFYKGIDCIMACLRDTNALMEFTKPWELSKENNKESKEKLSTILHVIYEVLKISGILLQPVIPNLSNRLLTKFQIPSEQRGWQNISCFPSYYHLPNPLEFHPLDKDSPPLYERRKE
ncbi:methionine--tRNA ligase, mitochondrial [Caerostris darwini]|uniref:Methionine--tRNA ligase, mitochondrial n=1 Tax=Caerostris darwini TaxID=1538125 RepID=A0AAV4Q8L8_9ARAC|nr:methionine--tRNA ligase, mitochondrial [Caerostris darwini]